MTEEKAKLESWQITVLSDHHRRDTFNCGVEPLNTFIRQHVERNTKQNYGRTFVAEALPLSNDRSIAGYYTTSMASISFASLPEKAARSLPKYPMPAALIARLAVDKRLSGKGLGSLLLIDALRGIARVAKSDIGCAAALVHAKDEKARGFYLKYGFTPLADNPNHLFMQIKTIEKLFP